MALQHSRITSASHDDTATSSPIAEEIDYSFDRSPVRYVAAQQSSSSTGATARRLRGFDGKQGLQLSSNDRVASLSDDSDYAPDNGTDSDDEDQMERLKSDDEQTTRTRSGSTSVPDSPGVHSISLASPVVHSSIRYNRPKQRKMMANGLTSATSSVGFDSVSEREDEDEAELAETEDERPPSLPPKPTLKLTSATTSKSEAAAVGAAPDKKPATTWREWLTAGLIGGGASDQQTLASSVTSTPAVSDVESSPGAQGPFPYEFIDDEHAFGASKPTPSLNVLLGDDLRSSGGRDSATLESTTSPRARPRKRSLPRRPRHLITVVPATSVAEGSPYLKIYLSKAVSRRGVLLPLRETLTEQVAAIAQEHGISSPEDISLYLLSAADSVKSQLVVPLENGPKISAEAWSSLWGDLFRRDSDEDEDSELDIGGLPYGKAESDRLHQTAPSPRHARSFVPNRGVNGSSAPPRLPKTPMHRSQSSPAPASPRIHGGEDWSARSPTPTNPSYGVDLVVGRLEFDIEPRGLFGVGYGDVNALAPFSTPNVPRANSVSAWAKRRGSKWTTKTRSENDTESIGTTPQFSTPAWSTPGGAKSSSSSLSNHRFPDPTDELPVPVPRIQSASTSSEGGLQSESQRSSTSTIETSTIPRLTATALNPTNNGGPPLFSRFSSSTTSMTHSRSDSGVTSTASPVSVKSPLPVATPHSAAVAEESERRPSVSLASFLGNVSPTEDDAARATPSLSSVAEEPDEEPVQVGLGVFRGPPPSKSTPQKMAELSKALGLSSPDPNTALSDVETPQGTPPITQHNPTFLHAAIDQLSVINELPETPKGCTSSRDVLPNDQTPVRNNTSSSRTAPAPAPEWQPFVPGFEKYQLRPSRPAPVPPSDASGLSTLEDPVIALRNSMVAPSDRGSFSGSSSGRRPSDEVDKRHSTASSNGGVSHKLSNAFGMFRTKSSTDVHDQARLSIGSESSSTAVSSHRRKHSGGSSRSLKLKNVGTLPVLPSPAVGTTIAAPPSPPLPNCSPTLPTSKTLGAWFKGAAQPKTKSTRHARSDSRSSIKSTVQNSSVPPVPPVPALHGSQRSSSAYDDADSDYDDEDDADALEVTLNRARTTSLVPAEVQHLKFGEDERGQKTFNKVEFSSPQFSIKRKELPKDVLRAMI
ncbi:hypothetical protein ACM66B_003245 [Microbotryomycetes sp. NB124-2]